MEISTNQYLDLVEEIKVLKEENRQKAKESILLGDEVIRQREQISFLEKQIKQFKDKQQREFNDLQNTMNYQTQALLQCMRSLNEDQKTFVSNQFQKIKIGGSLKKMKQMENKLEEQKKTFQKSNDFYQEVKAMYHSSTKKKAEPSHIELIKWIKKSQSQQKQIDSKARLSSETEQKKKRKPQKNVTIANLLSQPGDNSDHNFLQVSKSNDGNLVLGVTQSHIFTKQRNDEQ